ncbi:MAG: hypothetical protein DF168_00985 [Candidatus Moanabacter tarae]|uniref:Uncharacterized protein n=1 Tax=Candidatus Moanibacter tarae TaxID=2200854 RepID=A0A2Z4ALH3_9BACT|nr:MAG: hypothetical protein DF168_00985 [Candidatus Moanabacter tarae]
MFHIGSIIRRGELLRRTFGWNNLVSVILFLFDVVYCEEIRTSLKRLLEVIGIIPKTFRIREILLCSSFLRVESCAVVSIL